MNGMTPLIMRPEARASCVVLALIGFCACSQPRRSPDANPSPSTLSTDSVPPKASPGALVHIDVAPFSRAFEQGVPRKSPRAAVLAWLDGKKCCFKFGRNSNPIVARCPNPEHPTKPFQIDIDLDQEDRFTTYGVGTDYMNWEKSPCAP